MRAGLSIWRLLLLTERNWKLRENEFKTPAADWKTSWIVREMLLEFAG